MSKFPRKSFIESTSITLFATAAALSGMLVSIIESADTISFLGVRVELLSLASAAVASGIAAFFVLAQQQKSRIRRVKRRIFIVYAHQDIESAKLVCGWVKNAGFSPWLDVEQLLPGQLWKDEIHRAIEDSGAAIVLISENLSNSHFASDELSSALRKLQTSSGRITPILPVRIDDSPLPHQLEQIQAVAVDAPDAEKQLIRAIELVTDQERQKSGESVLRTA